jgi:plasmid stabilization system protein ParE
MNRAVKISKTAENKLDNLFDYHLHNWSQKVKSDFIEKLDKSIDLIKSTPEIFPKSDKQEGLHKCVITKQTTSY